jgi:hypothetical protein
MGFISVTLGLGGRHLNLAGSTRSPDDPEACGVVAGASRWLRFRADRARVVELSAQSSEAAVVVAVYANRVQLRPVAACAIVSPNGQPSTTAFGAVPDEDYLVMVAGVGNAVGRVELRWNGGESTELPTPGIGMQNGRVLLEWIMPPGLHDVSTSSDLVQWQSLFSTNSQGWLFRFQDPEAPLHPRRFYRIRSVRP